MLSYIVYFILFVIFLVSLWWYYFTSTRFYKLCSKIPGPPTLPIIGNLYHVFRDMDTFIRSVMNISEKYYPVSKGFIGNVCYIFLRDPDDIHTLLNSPKAISRAIGYGTLKRILGNELFTASPKTWKKYRQIANPGFSNTVIRSYIGIFNEKGKMLVDFIKSNADGKPFNIQKGVSLATLDAIIETSLGTKMNFQLNELIFINDSIDKGKEIIQYLLSCPWYWLDPIYNRSAISKEVTKLREGVHPYINKIIINKQRKYAHEDYESDFTTEAEKTVGYIDHVLKYVKENKEELTSEEIRDSIMSIMIAGSDTTAFTISVCLMLLGLHQDVQEKVVQELRDIFGENFNRPFEFEDLRRMEYMEQVIKETTRLFPGGGILGRKLEDDIEISGYTLPAGANVMVMTFSLHRDPKYFPDPLTFNPDRFSPENSRDRHPYCFIPFTSGPRMCIGHYFAMTQMKMFIGDVLRNYKILPYGSRQAMEDAIEMSVILNLKHGYDVCITPRNE